MDIENPADRPSPHFVPFPSVPQRGGKPGAALPLPRPLLVGQERELTTLEALQRHDDVPFVTLICPYGVGNTWFTLATAAEVAATFPAIAHAHSVQESGTGRQRVRRSCI
jgi:hypothetical protein